MRSVPLLAFATFLPMAFAGVCDAASLDVTYITQYCNETIQTTDLSTQPRMLRNIQGSLMAAAPSYLDDSIYLQRRTNENLCPDLIGIGETSQQWLQPNRISVSHAAVVIAAVSDQFFPGAGSLLTSLGWTPIGDSITLNYNQGVASVPLYAGLVPAGAVNISGSGVASLRSGGDEAQASVYFFFQDGTALPPELVAELKVVSVPEPQTGVLLMIAAGLLLAAGQSRLRFRLRSR